ncbi:hypothetical protein [Caballeronia sp. TF1N1]|uniref:hypothetical protein n=1 Tax=Caballeronia sp. TF1N1 TaxID=2878153 RepID=UPI001FD1D96D|nr:hypothetical protein [Caballeronia sp. TF1N1]
MPGTYDFNWGAAASPQFTMPGGVATPVYGYNSINQYGMASPTLGSAVPDLGGTLGTTQSLAGATAQAPGAFAGLGLNLPTLQLGLDSIGKIGSLYAGLSSLGLAKDQFSFQKDMANKNYTNSVSAYNTSLEDRANARASVDGSNAAAYIAAHKLS